MTPGMTDEPQWTEWAATALERRKVGEYVTLAEAARILDCTEDDVRDNGYVTISTMVVRQRRCEVTRVKELWTAHVESRGRQGLNPAVLERLRGVPVVYFLRGCGLTKIGYSNDVAARIANMQPGSPIRLRLAWATPGGKLEEQALHDRFAADRRHGEWFCLSHDQLRSIVEEFPLPKGVGRWGARLAFACHCGRLYATSRSYNQHQKHGHLPPLTTPPGYEGLTIPDLIEKVFGRRPAA